VKRDRGWRTFKRPGVDDFLQHVGRFYEIVVYSDQLSMVTKFPFPRLPVSVIFIIHEVAHYEFSFSGFCSMLILLLKGWIQTTLYDIDYQGVLPSIRMASIIE
jgi:predicted NodU family carbamoyl transferase